MLYQCSSASSCMRMRIVMEKHYTVCQHSIFFSEWSYAVLFVFCNIKRGWAHRRHTSLTQVYNNLLSDTSALIPTVTTLRSSLSMYVFFVYNSFSFLVDCLVNNSSKVTFPISLELISLLLHLRAFASS
jgi:hypothetical protein